MIDEYPGSERHFESPEVTRHPTPNELEETADALADLLVSLDKLNPLHWDAFREYFITAAGAEGCLDVGSCLSRLTQAMNEAFA